MYHIYSQDRELNFAIPSCFVYAAEELITQLSVLGVKTPQFGNVDLDEGVQSHASEILDSLLVNVPVVDAQGAVSFIKLRAGELASVGNHRVAFVENLSDFIQVNLMDRRSRGNTERASYMFNALASLFYDAENKVLTHGAAVYWEFFNRNLVVTEEGEDNEVLFWSISEHLDMLPLTDSIFGREIPDIQKSCARSAALHLKDVQAALDKSSSSR